MQSSKAQGAAPEEPASAAGGSKPVRVIKKYPNRRLYDTDSSSYITLGDVKALVMAGERFVVRDARTGEDLTRAILLQIILEEETGGVPLFSEQMLANIIRFYGHAMQGFMGHYLERNLQLFFELQQKMAEQAKDVTPELWQQWLAAQSPLMMGNLFAQSQKAFLQMQEQMLGALTGKRTH
ncbi:polyhydroxyalkanoate synthesis repressor PhaR [Tepidimonas ignava]|uniref:Polyhydroxyalkanoate synthesis repressor PhaR n=2 Tax=Tepidimonas ignava TaxID=114249 RepID=A0A4R3LJK6_9BURK|nr:polyhydroxyalkanoate synthesis repressor PhaR [Tepidimonas ignava]TSE19160.1 polyhydroxyalkanoate synthesis repressor PhaR [Tepidimonas ignava]